MSHVCDLYTVHPLHVSSAVERGVNNALWRTCNRDAIESQHHPAWVEEPLVHDVRYALSDAAIESNNAP